jgi:endonuclease III
VQRGGGADLSPTRIRKLKTCHTHGKGQVGRPAAGAALIDIGYSSMSELPQELNELKELHGVGQKAVHLLREAREQR